MSQALVFLGSASDEERMLFEKLRPAQFTPAPRRLTEELWQKNVIHPREDKLVGAIFSSTLGRARGRNGAARHRVRALRPKAAPISIAIRGR